MGRTSRRSEKVTAMVIVPVSPKPFYSGFHISHKHFIMNVALILDNSTWAWCCFSCFGCFMCVQGLCWLFCRGLWFWKYARGVPHCGCHSNKHMFLLKNMHVLGGWGFPKLNSNVNVSMPTSPLTLVILKNGRHELDKSVLFIQVYELQCWLKSFFSCSPKYI